MFEKHLSGIVPLPQEAQWAERYFQNKGERNLSTRISENLKQEDQLVMLAGQLVRPERDLEDDKKEALEDLFDASLTCNQNNREADLRRSFSRLMPN